jgi:hypothetical protein
MKKAECRLPVRGQRRPVSARDIQQRVGADDVAVDERAGPVDRAVDMRFRRQMHDRIRLVRGERGPHRLVVRDIGPDQDMTAAVPRFLKRRLGRGVGHLVDVDDGMIRLPDQITHDRGSDKSASTRQQQSHSHLACKAIGML